MSPTRHWLVGPAFALAGAILFALCAPRAAAADGWQLTECPPGEPCRPRGRPLDVKTACELDLASLAIVAAKGTRIRCDKLTTKKEGER